MENSLTIQEVLKNRDKYNLALPFMESHQINPLFKLNVSPIYANTSPLADEVYKVETRNFVDYYSPKKTLLDKLAAGAGIQFSPDYGDVVRIDENTWKGSAYGGLRLPDTSLLTSHNFKVINLLDEERKYRLLYQDRAARGISEKRAAQEASKRYAGKWQDSTYFIDEADRERYIEKSLLDAMALLRANAPQRAATGAILRVVRALIGIKGRYTMEELKKPFAVARISFSPDFNDPMVKQVMVMQAIQSCGNLFGNAQPMLPSVPQPAAVPQPAETGTDVEEEADFIDISALDDPAGAGLSQAARPHVQEPEPEDRTRDFCCDKCGEVITEKVWNYSVEKFERPLCYKCQKIVREGQRGGWR